MDILKTATEWAKAEVFSAQFFIFFGILFALGSLGFWQLGKTDMAKAFIYPTLVAGALLMIIGFGLIYSNKSRLASFPTDYQNNPTEFVQTEIARAEKTIKGYERTVFKAIPIIMIISALLIIFISTPMWRAIGITTIAMMICILLIDSNAKVRHVEYQKQLLLVEKQ